MKNKEFNSWFKNALLTACTVTQVVGIAAIVFMKAYNKKNNIYQPTEETKIFEAGEHVIYKNNVTRKDINGNGQIELIDGYEPFSINVKGGTVVSDMLIPFQYYAREQ